MEFIRAKLLSSKQKKEVNELWNNEYPKGLRHLNLRNFENYLEQFDKQHHILLTDESGIINAWFFDFIRENEKWFAMIVDSKVQGKGVGTALLNEAKKEVTELNGWVIDHNNDKRQNGEYYNSPIEFYIKKGFEILSETRLELDNISAVKIKWKI